MDGFRNPQLSDWPDFRSGGRCGAGGISLQFGHTGCQPIVLLAGFGGHRLYRLELLARHKIHIGDELLQPLPYKGIDLVLDAVGGARRIGEEFREAVEQRIFGLHGLYMTIR